MVDLKDFPSAMTNSQQRRAIKILKGIVLNDDEQNPGQSGYCDHQDTHDIRMLLIECGAMPDRRAKPKKRKGKSS